MVFRLVSELEFDDQGKIIKVTAKEIATEDAYKHVRSPSNDLHDRPR